MTVMLQMWNAMKLNTNKYDNFESVIYNANTNTHFSAHATPSIEDVNQPYTSFIADPTSA